MVRLFIRFDGGKYWQLNHQIHRATGPAIQFTDGVLHWFWYGQRITEYEHMMLSVQETVND